LTVAAPPKPADGKRRLPMVAAPEVAREEDEHRPAWHWAAIGTIGAFVVWYPLAMLVNAAARGAEPPVLVAGNALAFVLACGAGGLVVGRFGAQAGPRQAAVSGAATGVLAWGLAALGARGLVVWALLFVVVAALGGASGYAGGKLGIRLRSR
jgi:hypothetical protein